MFSRFWLAAFEAWAVAKILQSEAFHKGVRAIHRRVNRLPTPPEEMGGTKLDKPDSFLKHFMDEVKDQVGVNTHNKSKKK